MLFKLHLIPVCVVISIMTIHMKTPSSQTLPETRPVDAVIEFSLSGGRVPRGGVGHEQFIMSSQTVSSYRLLIAVEGDVFETSFEVSDGILDSIWQTLLVKRFDELETLEDFADDEDSRTIRVSWGEHEILARNGAVSRIEREWEEEWSALVQSLDEQMRRVLDPFLTEIPLHLAPTLSGQTITISVAGMPRYEGIVPEPVQDLPPTIVVRFPPVNVVLGVVLGDAPNRISGGLMVDVVTTQVVQVSVEGDRVTVQPIGELEAGD